MKIGVIPASKWATGRDARKSGIWVSDVFLHVNYLNNTNNIFDIAVLRLEEDIPSNKFKKVELSKPPKHNTVVKAAGYGSLNDAKVGSKRLRDTDVVFNKFKWCKKNEPYWFRLSSSFSKRTSICATS